MQKLVTTPAAVKSGAVRKGYPFWTAREAAISLNIRASLCGYRRALFPGPLIDCQQLETA